MELILLVLGFCFQSVSKQELFTEERKGRKGIEEKDLAHNLSVLRDLLFMLFRFYSGSKQD